MNDNPKNQYIASCFFQNKASDVKCYMFDNELRVSKDKFISKEYIKSIIRVHDNESIKL